MKCSVKDCAKAAVADIGFFTNPKQFEKDPDTGMIFELCPAHHAYYKALQNMADYAIYCAQMIDKWNFPVPKFSIYEAEIKKIEEAEKQKT